MPFGLRNAAQSFQRFIDVILRRLPFVFVYVDDVLVASLSPEEHLRNLHLVFERFAEHGLIVNREMCVQRPILGVSGPHGRLQWHQTFSRQGESDHRLPTSRIASLFSGPGELLQAVYSRLCRNPTSPRSSPSNYQGHNSHSWLV